MVKAPKKRAPDFVRMACTSANVRYRETLTEDQLVHALLSGKVPRNRRPHLRGLLEEAPRAVLKGLVEQVGKWTKPGKVEQNVVKLAGTLQVSERVHVWLTAEKPAARERSARPKKKGGRSARPFPRTA